MTTVKSDPTLYRELSKPFENIDLANEALTAFLTDMEESRKKRKIPDVAVVVRVNYMADGQEHSSIADAGFGHMSHQLPMLATAFGSAREREKLFIDGLYRGKAAR
jgi:hypothetical protein